MRDVTEQLFEFSDGVACAVIQPDHVEVNLLAATAKHMDGTAILVHREGDQCLRVGTTATVIDARKQAAFCFTTTSRTAVITVAGKVTKTGVIQLDVNKVDMT